MSHHHVSWTEIENFHTLRRTLRQYPHLIRGHHTVQYAFKVKLHGTNAGVCIEPDGTVTAFSRTNVVSPGSDNAGFAAWVAANKDAWSAMKGTLPFVVYGEWCGPGVQKGVAVTQIPNKIFAPFAVRTLTPDSENDAMLFEPAEVAASCPKLDDVHVIPWFNDRTMILVDWSAEEQVLQPTLDRINTYVDAVEQKDPFISARFGVDGVGEGLVAYPIGRGHLYANVSDLMFKAKGKKHQVVAHTKPVQLDPTVASDMSSFAELVVTTARLEQATMATNDGKLEYDIKRVGEFMKWINLDVLKECQGELEASGLEQKQAMKACTDRARNWYIERSRSLK